MSDLKPGRESLDALVAEVELWQQDVNEWLVGNREDQLFILGEGETAPHAICLAALKA